MKNPGLGLSVLMRRSQTLIAVACIAFLAACSTSPITPTGDQIVVVGDSYTTGPNDDGKDSNVWPAMVLKDLRESGYDATATVSGEGGAGYANPGYRGGVFAGKAQAIQPSTELVVFFGSANDMYIPPDVLKGAVHETLKKATLTAPKAHLLVIGPAWPRPDVLAEVWRVRDVVRDEATAIGATFVDPLEQRWLWDDPALIGPDGIHPNRAGQRYLAEKIRPLFQAELPAPRP
ncbi:MAG: SGNH/GDSL hydrolase family protein [Planctomycetota bacterium]